MVSRRRTRASALALAALLVSCIVAGGTAGAAPNNNSVQKLTAAVTVDGVLDHLSAFQAIADANGGNRAAGQPGYRASVDYVTGRLRAAGYTPSVQAFEFEYTRDDSQLVRHSPAPRTFVNGVDFYRTELDPGSSNVPVTGPLVNVDLTINPAGPPNSSTSGCEAADFAGFPVGGVALVQRGTCSYGTKLSNAQAAGAVAVVAMNEGQPGRTGLLALGGSFPGFTLPTVLTTFAAGVDLSQHAGSIVTVGVDYSTEVSTAWNVITETSTGNDDNVVMAGAHLDSVPAGPGINDNGSGSAALLEVAEQMAKVKPNNTVRFAWWGAEEEGLLGSQHYVDDLVANDPGGLADVAVYLNFDMIASPNYTFAIYDGDNSMGTVDPELIPAGSAQIEDVFEAFYGSRNLPFTETDFDGRSDYGPFIAVGIPAGGLFTGAEELKTPTEEAIFGGTAGLALDPCYHSACDTLANISLRALDVNSDAMAHAIATLAASTSTVNSAPSAPGRSHGAGKSAQAVSSGPPKQSVS